MYHVCFPQPDYLSDIFLFCKISCKALEHCWTQSRPWPVEEFKWLQLCLLKFYGETPPFSGQSKGTGAAHFCPHQTATKWGLWSDLLPSQSPSHVFRRTSVFLSKFISSQRGHNPGNTVKQNFPTWCPEATWVLWIAAHKSSQCLNRH